MLIIYLYNSKLKIKHCPCPKYVMIYRADLCNLQIKLRLEIDLFTSSTTK